MSFVWRHWRSLQGVAEVQAIDPTIPMGEGFRQQMADLLQDWGQLPVARPLFSNIIGALVHYAAFYEIARLAWEQVDGEWRHVGIVEVAPPATQVGHGKARKRKPPEDELLHAVGHGPGYEQGFAKTIFDILHSLRYPVRGFGEGEAFVAMTEAAVGLLTCTHATQMLEAWEGRWDAADGLNRMGALALGFREVNAFIVRHGYVSWTAKHAWGSQKNDDRILAASQEVFFDIATALIKEKMLKIRAHPDDPIDADVMRTMTPRGGRYEQATENVGTGKPDRRGTSGLWAPCVGGLAAWEARLSRAVKVAYEPCTAAEGPGASRLHIFLFQGYLTEADTRLWADAGHVLVFDLRGHAHYSSYGLTGAPMETWANGVYRTESSSHAGSVFMDVALRAGAAAGPGCSLKSEHGEYVLSDIARDRDCLVEIPCFREPCLIHIAMVLRIIVQALGVIKAHDPQNATQQTKMDITVIGSSMGTGPAACIAEALHKARCAHDTPPWKRDPEVDAIAGEIVARTNPERTFLVDPGLYPAALQKFAWWASKGTPVRLDSVWHEADLLCRAAAANGAFLRMCSTGDTAASHLNIRGFDKDAGQTLGAKYHNGLKYLLEQLPEPLKYFNRAADAPPEWVANGKAVPTTVGLSLRQVAAVMSVGPFLRLFTVIDEPKQGEKICRIIHEVLMAATCAARARSKWLSPSCLPASDGRSGLTQFFEALVDDVSSPAGKSVATLWRQVAENIQQRFAMQVQATMVEVLKVPDLDGFPGLLGAGLSPDDKGGPLTLLPPDRPTSKRYFTVECRLPLLGGKIGVVKIKYEKEYDPPGWALWGNRRSPEKGIRLGQLLRAQGNLRDDQSGERLGRRERWIGWVYVMAVSTTAPKDRGAGGDVGWEPLRHFHPRHMCHRQRAPPG
jgi:hypothetical protein